MRKSSRRPRGMCVRQLSTSASPLELKLAALRAGTERWYDLKLSC